MLRTHPPKAAAVAALAFSLAAAAPAFAGHGNSAAGRVTATTAWETAPATLRTTAWE
ncbi:hypothetical protein ACIF8W_37150 [Streptomyces sp. NPDC085639]|uniref:hypothetical protein n=1 Tax=Streptomyces sp. NPDC085639 TaxID=3365734 RepID=UPI0037D78F91